MTELVARKNELPTPGDWATMLDMAEKLVDSGLLPKHITTPAAAVAIIQRGIELGVPPMYALNNIVYIAGKATTNSELMLALVYRDQGDGAIVFTRTDNRACHVTYRRRGWAAPQRFEFSIDDAKMAGLLSNATWQKYPAAMLRARAISAVARMAFPDSIGGMYTPEELGATVDIDREGHYVVVDETPPERTVTEDGEILDEPTMTLDEQLRADINRIIEDANECASRGHLRLLGDEAQRKGLLADPDVLGALQAAKARLVPDSVEQQVLVKG